VAIKVGKKYNTQKIHSEFQNYGSKKKKNKKESCKKEKKIKAFNR
jgi:hypothetical protein